MNQRVDDVGSALGHLAEIAHKYAKGIVPGWKYVKRQLTHKGASMPLEALKDSPTDFDFIIGSWTVRHERLNQLFSACTEWTEFSGLSSTSKTLGGYGNIEDNLLRFPDGDARAIAIRSYSTDLGTWSIWWLDGRNPGTLDTPVVGKFDSGIGTFFADDTMNGTPIRVRFTWFSTTTENPRWEQAFSNDGGQSWETNWRMEFIPA